MNFKHGFKGNRLYGVWSTMKNRCNNPNNESYHNYGGRGIKVWEEWEKDFLNFYFWATDEGYKPGMSLQLIDRNKDFSPWNARFVSEEELNIIRRRGNYIEVDGEKHTLGEWSKRSGIKLVTLRARYRKGIRGRELLQPVRGKKDGETANND